MYKVEHADLEKITRFLDKLSKNPYPTKRLVSKCSNLSKMIKDKYTEIKPHYDSINRR
jgi:hypothetical protein